MPRLLRRPTTVRFLLAAALAVVVTLALFAFGRWHTPNYAMKLFGRSGTGAVALKSWLATIVLGLAALQLVLALWMYRRLPGARAVPRPVPILHRIGGGVLFLVTVPIAIHCILAYGVQLGTPRLAVHSIAGCFFYGAFAAKVLLVRSRRLPGLALPLVGGTLVTVIVVLWYASALWYFHGYRLPGL